MLQTTPLHQLHRELGAKLVPFAGWDMPLQYEGVIAEHLWCRSHAALFDVAHMAVVDIVGIDGTAETAAAALERITPAGVTTLGVGRQRYGLMLNDEGGTVDDFMVTNWGSHLTMVLNASRREADLEHLAASVDNVSINERADLALIAIQGPSAATALGSVLAEGPEFLDKMSFLDVAAATVVTPHGPAPVALSRSGYTGEDGFELAVDHDRAEAVARVLLTHDEVRPAGLGARDTLRLEAGLCLYGNDLDETISPVEADLVWTMPKRRREAGDFLGAERVQAELADGPSRIRVGIKPEGRRPVRDGARLTMADGSADGIELGSVSSGGFGPSVNGPVAMGYVDPGASSVGTVLDADVRGKTVVTAVADLPFSPHNYRRSA